MAKLSLFLPVTTALLQLLLHAADVSSLSVASSGRGKVVTLSAAGGAGCVDAELRTTHIWQSSTQTWVIAAAGAGRRRALRQHPALAPPSSTSASFLQLERRSLGGKRPDLLVADDTLSIYLNHRQFPRCVLTCQIGKFLGHGKYANVYTVKGGTLKLTQAPNSPVAVGAPTPTLDDLVEARILPPGYVVPGALVLRHQGAGTSVTGEDQLALAFKDDKCGWPDIAVNGKSIGGPGSTVTRNQAFSRKKKMIEHGIFQFARNGGKTTLDKAMVKWKLEVFLRQSRPWDHWLENVRLFLLAASYGLDEVHKMDFVNADIKGDNTFVHVDTKGLFLQVSIGDFGFAKKLPASMADRDSPALVETKRGTPTFMAPEVLLYHQLRAPIGSADVFAAGITVRCMFDLCSA